MWIIVGGVSMATTLPPHREEHHPTERSPLLLKIVIKLTFPGFCHFNSLCSHQVAAPVNFHFHAPWWYITFELSD